jgi:Holliday junction resolvasome RuvABC DNA-binding subunit
MKKIKQTIATFLLIVSSCVTYAQSIASNINDQSKTRAQVKAELTALESVGYNPNDWINYPENIEQAQQKLWKQKQASVQ